MSKNTSTHESERLALTVRDVAGLLGISERHVWKLHSTSRLPRPIRLGRSVRWLRRDIEAALEAMKGGGR
jgi:predicted DNA-binding transcriptional regulator AlpA